MVVCLFCSFICSWQIHRLVSVRVTPDEIANVPGLSRGGFGDLPCPGLTHSKACFENIFSSAPSPRPLQLHSSSIVLLLQDHSAEGKLSLQDPSFHLCFRSDTLLTSYPVGLAKHA